jgi:hypothetical protein
MRTFWEWLLEGRKGEIEPSVLHGYDEAFKDRLRELIGRTSDPSLRVKLDRMLDCPIRDSKGNCRGFAEYIHAALLKNGIAHQYDIEAALSYVVGKMLMDRSEVTGGPKANLFAGFTERPHTPDFNPLQARFMAFLQGAINNIRKGNIVRLLNVQRRPPGTISIGQGGEEEGRVSPDEIADRPSSDAAFKEMVDDILTLLRPKQRESGLPLAGLFRAMMNGQRSDEQRRRFGDRTARAGRQVIIQTVKDYAASTGNWALLNLLVRTGGDGPSAFTAPRQRAVKVVKAKLSEKERDYASIVSVIDRLGRPVGTADLGKYRRRWLDYPPRNSSSGHRNRLEEVLAQMVRDDVLRVTRTSRGAVLYSPGPNFDQYRATVAR